MVLLERVNLIQFFLCEARDVDIGRNTAFLGVAADRKLTQ